MTTCRRRTSGQTRLGGSIFQSILTRKLSVDGIAASIPATGRVLAIANHPYGVIDGLVLCALMAEVRQDYKIITHRVLRQAPAVMDKILPVDFDETEAALASNLKTRADAAKHLKDGGAVIVFPAGAISLAPNLVGDAIDTEWKTFAAKLAQVPDTTTIPFYFDGRNSLLYQMARRISVTLGYSLMFREICKKMGHTISLEMRQPVPCQHPYPIQHPNRSDRIFAQMHLWSLIQGLRCASIFIASMAGGKDRSGWSSIDVPSSSVTRTKIGLSPCGC